MNHCVPDWNVVSDSRSFSDLPGRNQKKSMGLDQELMEILWHNGQVVLNSQTNRKPTAQSIESKQVLKIDHSLKGNGCIGISNDPVQDDETSAWIQYPVDDSLEKEFYPDFFYELPSNYTNSSDKPKKQIIVDEMEEFLLGGTVKSQLREKEPSDLNHGDNLMPPPRSQLSDAFPKDQNKCTGKITNFSHFSRSFKTNLGSSAPTQVSHVIHGEAGESSGMTVASSHCRSNQVQNDNDVTQILTYYQCDNKDNTGSVSENLPKVLHQQNRAKSDFLEPTATSSSGGSGGSCGRSNKQDASNENNKRKVRDGEESESHSEEAEYGSADTNRPPKHSTPSRRSRAAEVHNLSERRRRDRINEKMKALQELIPHCNKTDKASMLDEAIEYLKSLQLQLQMMWMGSGMAPMMFPGVQHFMPHMGMGMARPPLPSMSNHMPFPRVPLVSPSVSLPPVPNQPQLCSSKAINPMNFPIQLPNSNVPDAYARYLGFHHMQAATQAMNLFTYGPQLTSPSSTNAPCGGTIPLNNTPSDKSGQ